VVFELDSPIRLEPVFDSSAQKPAAVSICISPDRRSAREGKRRAILRPATAYLAVSQPAVDGNSKTCSDGADPFLAVEKLNRPQRRGHRKARTAKGAPIKVSFDANQKMTSLQVVTELEPSGECTAEWIIPRRARDVQCAVGPGTPNIGAQIRP